MAYTHLTSSERTVIYTMLKKGRTHADIAESLGRAPSTISRELMRNRCPDGDYDPNLANWYAKDRRRWLRPNYKRMREDLMAHVETHLRQAWSPDQIAGRLRHVDYPNDPGWWISHQTIYTHVREDHRNGGTLHTFLRHGRRTYDKRFARCAGRGHIKDRVSIDERPEAVNRQETFGHWEADTIYGKGRNAFVATLVERKSLYLLAQPMRDLKSDTFNHAAITALKTVPRQLRQTLTCDNGPEFSGFKLIEKKLRCRVYFAHPYHAWERPINENTNGLLRQYLPKRRTLTTLTQEELNTHIHQLNHRPRKKLDYRTPHEVFHEATLALRA